MKKTEQLNIVGTIVGVLGGFGAGIYIPLSLLGNTVGKVIVCLPFIQFVTLLKQVLVKDELLKLLDNAPDDIKEQVFLENGLLINFGDTIISIMYCTYH